MPSPSAHHAHFSGLVLGGWASQFGAEKTPRESPAL